MQDGLADDDVIGPRCGGPSPPTNSIAPGSLPWPAARGLRPGDPRALAPVGGPAAWSVAGPCRDTAGGRSGGGGSTNGRDRPRPGPGGRGGHGRSEGAAVMIATRAPGRLLAGGARLRTRPPRIRRTARYRAPVRSAPVLRPREIPIRPTPRRSPPSERRGRRAGRAPTRTADARPSAGTLRTARPTTRPGRPADGTSGLSWSPSCARSCGCATSAGSGWSMSFSSFGDWLGLLATTARGRAGRRLRGGQLRARRRPRRPAAAGGHLRPAGRRVRRPVRPAQDSWSSPTSPGSCCSRRSRWSDTLVAVRRDVPDRVRSACSGSRPRKPRSPTWSAGTSWRRPTRSASSRRTGSPRCRRAGLPARAADRALADRSQLLPPTGSTSRSTSTRSRSWSPR